MSRWVRGESSDDITEEVMRILDIPQPIFLVPENMDEAQDSASAAQMEQAETPSLSTEMSNMEAFRRRFEERPLDRARRRMNRISHQPAAIMRGILREQMRSASIYMPRRYSPIHNNPGMAAHGTGFHGNDGQNVEENDNQPEVERASLSGTSPERENLIEAGTSRIHDVIERSRDERMLELQNNIGQNFVNESNEIIMDSMRSTAADEEDASQSQESITEEEPAFTNVRRHQFLNKSLLNLLECPVCLENMEPPICQCRRGHLLCYHCRARLCVCPVCRSALSSVRNRAMEKVAEIIMYPCRHGCSHVMHLRHRRSHEDNCVQRKHPCPMTRCGRGPMQLHSLREHLQSHHEIHTGADHKLSVKLNKDQHSNWAIVVYNELFHVRLDLQLRTWCLTIYVTYIGPKKHATKYDYKISLVGNPYREMAVKRTTHSDVDNFSFTVTRKDCFYMCLEHATNYLRGKSGKYNINELLTFHLSILKKEVNQVPDVPSDVNELPVSI